MENEKMYGKSVSQNEKVPADIQPNYSSESEVDEAHEFDRQVEGQAPSVEDSNPEDSSCSDTEHSFGTQSDKLSIGVDYLKQIDGRLDGIAVTEQRLFSEIREMHKLYHSEFAGRLKSMQDELEQYRKVDKGRAFDDILGAIARIYGNNETLVDEVQEPKAKKSIRYLLLDIEDLLSVYGMSMLRSAPGDKRNPRHCQVLERIPTDDPARHDTVVKSYNTGFFIGHRTVIKEVVDIYFYDGSVVQTKEEEKQTTETATSPVSE